MVKAESRRRQGQGHEKIGHTPDRLQSYAARLEEIAERFGRVAEMMKTEHFSSLHAWDRGTLGALVKLEGLIDRVFETELRRMQAKRKAEQEKTRQS